MVESFYLLLMRTEEFTAETQRAQRKTGPKEGEKSEQQMRNFSG